MQIRPVKITSRVCFAVHPRVHEGGIFCSGDNYVFNKNAVIIVLLLDKFPRDKSFISH